MQLKEYFQLLGAQKKKKKYEYVEEREQIALFERAQYYPMIDKHLIGSANGGLRNLFVAKKLKAAGAKKGVSDILFAYPCKGYAGLWIELKRKDATPSHLSKEQKEWLRTMCNAGYMGKMARGADEAWQIINDYLDGKCEYDEWYSKASKNQTISSDTRRN